MTIEISGVPGKPVQDTGEKSSVSATTTNRGSSKAPASTHTSGNDTVSLTSSAMKLHALEDRIAELAGFITEVNEIITNVEENEPGLGEIRTLVTETVQPLLRRILEAGYVSQVNNVLECLKEIDKLEDYIPESADL